MLRFKPAVDEIAPIIAARLVDEGSLTLVDVRDAAERRAIAPAVPSLHIPLSTLAARLDELPRDRPVAFVCAAGGRSAVAAKAAATAGFTTRNVTGGMTAWAASGTATTKTGR